MSLVSSCRLYLWFGTDFVFVLRRDVNSYSKTKATLEPTTIFRGHTSVVGVRSPFSLALTVLPTVVLGC